jgi:hypothetical protein
MEATTHLMLTQLTTSKASHAKEIHWIPWLIVVWIAHLKPKASARMGVTSILSLLSTPYENTAKILED